MNGILMAGTTLERSRPGFFDGSGKKRPPLHGGREKGTDEGSEYLPRKESISFRGKGKVFWKRKSQSFAREPGFRTKVFYQQEKKYSSNESIKTRASV